MTSEGNAVEHLNVLLSLMNRTFGKLIWSNDEFRISALASVDAIQRTLDALLAEISIIYKHALTTFMLDPVFNATQARQNQIQLSVLYEINHYCLTHMSQGVVPVLAQLRAHLANPQAIEENDFAEIYCSFQQRLIMNPFVRLVASILACYPDLAHHRTIPGTPEAQNQAIYFNSILQMPMAEWYLPAPAQPSGHEATMDLMPNDATVSSYLILRLHVFNATTVCDPRQSVFFIESIRKILWLGKDLADELCRAIPTIINARRDVPPKFLERLRDPKYTDNSPQFSQMAQLLSMPSARECMRLVCSNLNTILIMAAASRYFISYFTSNESYMQKYMSDIKNLQINMADLNMHCLSILPYIHSTINTLQSMSAESAGLTACA